MTEDRLVSLITRQQSGQLTPMEAAELEGWANESAINRVFLEKVSDEKFVERDIHDWINIDPGKGFARWRAHRQVQRRAHIRRITGWSVAASLLIAAVMVGLLVERHSGVVQPASSEAISQPVQPGRNTAILTLANGQQVALDSVAKGFLTMQGASQVVKGDSGNLSYLAKDEQLAAATYNILTTPRSAQYQLRLPDGSRVWLNNVSSLRYPTSFRGKDRTVELNGEAYFEITKDASRPFFVKVRDESIEVLGTSFNVMAYPEEGGTQTTLLTGAIRVQTGSAAVKLQPNEQALVTAAGGLNVIKEIPSQDVVSWKDGFFYFGRASFETMMRQLARWYDVDVVYVGKAPNMEFGGKIDRNLRLEDLLKFLDQNQIHFRLQGRKLIVLPN